jgi:Holliday junction resolvase RusA-like endonuclease
MKFILKGQIVSKKNNYKFGKGRFYNCKQKELDALILDLREQVVDVSVLPIKSDCRLILRFWQGFRTDLDNQINTIMDALQNSGIILNDRQIKEIQAKKYKDNKNPRVEIELEILK